MAKGLAIFRMKHTGTRNFSVTLLDGTGNEVALLANVIGNYDGSTAYGVTQAGPFVANIDADGAWTLSLEQPTALAAKVLPVSWKGTGPAVAGYSQGADGLATFQMSHKGSRNFAVTLLDASGQEVDLLANTIGAFDGSKATRLSSAIYVVQVEADGAWTVDVQ
jgi:hypothetical protein